MGDLRERLIGSWTLARAELTQPDGKKLPVFGSAPVSHLFYTRDGYVSLHVMPGGTPPEDDVFPEPPVSIYSYCGYFRVDEDHVYHDISVSMNPGWVGATLRRSVRFEGEHMVMISTDLFPSGREGKVELTWRPATPFTETGETE